MSCIPHVFSRLPPPHCCPLPAPAPWRKATPATRRQRTRHRQFAAISVTAQEALEIEQQYLLSNQQILVVREQNQHFYGRLSDKNGRHDKAEVEIFPQAPGLFVTRRGATFAFSNAGEHVVIDDAQYLPGLRMPADSRTRHARSKAAHSVRLVSR